MRVYNPDTFWVDFIEFKAEFKDIFDTQGLRYNSLESFNKLFDILRNDTIGLYDLFVKSVTAKKMVSGSLLCCFCKCLRYFI